MREICKKNNFAFFIFHFISAFTSRQLETRKKNFLHFAFCNFFQMQK